MKAGDIKQLAADIFPKKADKFGSTWWKYYKSRYRSELPMSRSSKSTSKGRVGLETLSNINIYIEKFIQHSKGT
jgi:hypothetical protein